MKVRILKAPYWTYLGHEWLVGEVMDLPPRLAARLAREGYAMPVETTSVEPTENTARLIGRRRRKHG